MPTVGPVRDTVADGMVAAPSTAKCSNPLDEVQIGGGQCWSVGAKVLEAEGLILFADQVVLAAGTLTEAMQEEGGCQRQTAKEPGKGWCGE